MAFYHDHHYEFDHYNHLYNQSDEEFHHDLFLKRRHTMHWMQHPWIQLVDAAAYFDRIVANFFGSLVAQGHGKVVDRLLPCFDAISTIYRQQLHDTDIRSDWGDGHNRCAYTYRFFALHCHLVYRGLQMALLPNLQLLLRETWRNNFSLRVCCIGGGPGSDIVGLTRFIRDNDLCPTWGLECSVFDLHPEWENTWMGISKANPPGEFPVLSYLPGDITRTNPPLSPRGRLTIQSADIITAVKVFSSVVAFMKKDALHGNLLREIFQEMKPGALLFYIDNFYKNDHRSFQAMAYDGGVTEHLFEWHGEMNYPAEVTHSETINRIIQGTGFKPLQRCSVSVMLLRKPLTGGYM